MTEDIKAAHHNWLEGRLAELSAEVERLKGEREKAKAPAPAAESGLLRVCRMTLRCLMNRKGTPAEAKLTPAEISLLERAVMDAAGEPREPGPSAEAEIGRLKGELETLLSNYDALARDHVQSLAEIGRLKAVLAAAKAGAPRPAAVVLLRREQGADETHGFEDIDEARALRDNPYPGTVVLEAVSCSRHYIWHPKGGRS